MHNNIYEKKYKTKNVNTRYWYNIITAKWVLVVTIREKCLRLILGA